MFGVFGLASFSKRIDVLSMPDQVLGEPLSVALGHCVFGVVDPECVFGCIMDRLSIFCFKYSKKN